ncbi:MULTISPECIES: DUF6680 family protein [unclassified Methylobacterium]|uniref:DUF6680 family protein n=1 Tax=unclassified Methylobacterium TaxID=2615210 RepID=UPI0036F8EE05
MTETWKWADYIAASNVLIATVAAALALAAPYLGWRLARRSQLEDQKRQTKLNIFGLLVENRNLFHSRETIRALNAIDVAFHDNEEIRQIWREYHGMISKPAFFDTSIGNELRSQKLIDLQAAIARDLGYSVDRFDIERVYSPDWLVEEQEVAILERQVKLRDLRNATAERGAASGKIGTGPVSAPIPQDVSGRYIMRSVDEHKDTGFVLFELIDGTIRGCDLFGNIYKGVYAVLEGRLRAEAKIISSSEESVTSEYLSRPVNDTPIFMDLPLDFAGGRVHQMIIFGRTIIATFVKLS